MKKVNISLLYKSWMTLERVQISDRQQSDRIMAGMKTTLVCLLLICLLQDSLSRHGSHALRPRIQRELKGSKTRVTDIQTVLTEYNISLPDGFIDYEVDCTVVNRCSGLEEQLDETKRKLQQKTRHAIQLEQDAYNLQATVRKLKVQSGTCTVNISGQIENLQSELEVKMRQLEQISHDKGIMVLRITLLTSAVKELQKKISLTSTPTKNTELQSDLEEIKRQLKFKTQELEKNSQNSKLVLEIIDLQTEIWELQKTNRTQETLNKISVLQRQLDRRINELESNPMGSDNTEIVMMIMTLESEVAELQKRIVEVNEKSKTEMTNLKKQLEDLIQQLKDKILELPEDNTNMELTEEILKLQNTISNLSRQISNLEKMTNDQHAELQKQLNMKAKQLQSWKEKVKGEEDAYTQLIVQIIYIMKEQRDFQVQRKDEHQKTRNQINDLIKQIESKKEDIVQLQAENQALREQLMENNATCASFKIKFDKVKEEVEDKINLLNNQRSGISKLILTIVALNDEVKWLRTQIMSPEASDRIDELQKQLEQKNRELKMKSKELQDISSNGQNILRMIQVQNLIWEFQKGPETQDNTDQIAVLQKELGELIAEMEEKKNDDSKIVLMIMSLKSEIVHLQKRLSTHSQTTAQIVELEKQLEFKKKLLAKLVEQIGKDDQKSPEFSKHRNQITEIENSLEKLKDATPDIDIPEITTQLKEREKQLEDKLQELKEMGGNNYYLIVEILNLQKKLRDIRYAASQRLNASAATVTELQQTLEAEKEKTTRCLAQNKDLEKRMSDKHAYCSELQKRYDNLQGKLKTTLNGMEKTAGYSNKLILEVWSLTNEVGDLKMRTASSAEEANEIQELLKAKTEELTTKTEQLKKNAPQPNNILRIIEIYKEIFNLQKGVTNENTFNQIDGLQTELDTLIGMVQDKENTNSKLILQIIALQNQVTRLQRQRFEFNQTSVAKITDLENQLEKTRQQLNEKTQALKSTVNIIPQLNSVIMDLRNKLTNLQITLSDFKQKSTDRIEELQNLMEQKSKKLEDKTTELRLVNDKNAEQILTIIEVQQQMKELRTEESQAKDKAEADIAGLKEQLMAKKEESARCLVQNKLLKNELADKEGNCSVIKERLTNLQTEQAALLNKTGEKDKLLLQVWSLKNEVLDLNNKIESSADDTSNLQVALAEKIKLLKMKTEELEKNVPEPKKILKIIAIQDIIYKLEKGVTNETTFNRIAELEKELEELVATVQDKNNGNCKTILQIIALQNQVARLQKQTLKFNQTFEAKIAELENQLEQTRDQLNEKKRQLKKTAIAISKLSAEIITLRDNLNNLEKELSELKEANKARIEELEGLLEQKHKELEDKTTELKVADAKNAENVLKVVELQEEMKQIREEGSNASEKKIFELNTKLTAKTKENLRLESKNKELEKIVKETKTVCDDIQSSCKEGTQENNKIKEERNKLQQQLQQMEDQSNDLKLTLRGTKEENARLQKEKANLQETVTDLQQEIENIKAGPTAAPIPTVNPDTILHRVKVGLDPNTAHPKVTLSDDGTEMLVSQTRRNVDRSPERYDLAIAALGKIGYDKGRTYWEVDVLGQTCYNIGVASASANRNGLLRLRPASGYWTLMLSRTGALQAYIGKPFNLQLSVLPQKLGILLDYPAGEISFYNAGTRSLLYTFTGNTFTEKLYPFVSACVDMQKKDVPIVFNSVGSVSWLQ
ncbi:putative leucine-rich repeat-containing protein DDB_G0290503 isoform X1 [Esox lucius]|nr:putative leucine-rich repeat-containing protein DDB_G0290503 isoform X1 [Esox lucius]